jgi:transcriptional regulator with XRE-family HTH domain
MDLKKVVARNLRRIRYAQGLTQEVLADRAELSARYIGKIESGVVSPSVTIIGRLAEALSIDAGELVRDDRPGDSK